MDAMPRKAATEGGVFGPHRRRCRAWNFAKDANVHNVSINHTRTFSPNLLNELLVGAHRSYKSSGTLADFEDWPQGWGCRTRSAPGMADYVSSDWFGWDSDNRKDEALTAGVLENNVTWNKGKHTVQFGGKYRREWNNVRELQQAQGSHDFAGPWTSLYSPADDDAVPFTGSGFADLCSWGCPAFSPTSSTGVSSISARRKPGSISLTGGKSIRV